MRKRPLLQMFVIGAIATAIGIPLALIVPWFPAAASAQAKRVDTLYDVLLVASVPIFVLVETVVLFSVWKFRMRPGEENKDGPPIHGNTRLEVMWTAGPAILIVSLCTYAYTVLHKNEESVKGETTVNVIGEQFAWTFAYPRSSSQAVVASQLYLAKGQPVVFRIHSRDVIHEFYVPAFRIGLDAVPGITTTLRATPNRLGSYSVICAELCGSGHSLMRAIVHVLPPAAYQAWLARQPLQATPTYSFGTNGGGLGSPAGPAPTAPAGASPTSPAAGKVVFTGVGGCGACHTLGAAGTTGTVGPNLGLRLATDCKTPTSIKVRGATPQQCIYTAITKPYAYLPTGYPAGIMPANFSTTLTSTQIQALVNFLASVTK